MRPALAIVLIASAAFAADAPTAAAAAGERVVGTRRTAGGQAQVRLERVGDPDQRAKHRFCLI